MTTGRYFFFHLHCTICFTDDVSFHPCVLESLLCWIQWAVTFRSQQFHYFRINKDLWKHRWIGAHCKLFLLICFGFFELEFCSILHYVSLFTIRIHGIDALVATKRVVHGCWISLTIYHRNAKVTNACDMEAMQLTSCCKRLKSCNRLRSVGML